MMQELHFEIRRHKTHLFISAKENGTVGLLKQMIEGILKVPVRSQTLIKIDDNGTQTLLHSDDTTLANAGFNTGNAKAQAPHVIGLRIAGDPTLIIESLSIPPPIPDAMRHDGHND